MTRAVLGVLAVLATLVTMVVIGLGKVGAGRRPSQLLLDARRGPAQVLVESPHFALSPTSPGNRFDTGWEPRKLGDPPVVALVPTSGAARLEAVNLGEEVERTLTLDLVRQGLPEGERLSVRAGDREVAQATLHAAALPLRVRLPEDLPVGLIALDLVFGPDRGGARGLRGPRDPRDRGGEPAPQALPGVLGASLAPALPPGSARIEGADLVQSGNCLVYLRCELAGDEALSGAFVPPAEARPGQRFELSVERLDGTPIRRFRWLPSFWNGLRGTRHFELPLRQYQGAVRVRLISRAGEAGGGPARWQALGLVSVTGEILTPGQGQ